LFRQTGQRLQKTSRELCTLADMESLHIRRALQVAGGNATRASELLKIGRSTLYRKLHAYKISYPEPPSPEKSAGLAQLLG
ncbi:MAG: hypothetical protein IH921_13400, partial [Gemmatimonadetes bacterium]|nr:hypothetical protein [Gemmatimonadota bacterium]